ncbi:MAG: terminase TerL endonuclease subunit [Thermoanaerobaculia bacterium]
MSDAIFDQLLATRPEAKSIDYAQRAVDYLRSLTHPKSGDPFQLDPWQEDIVRRIYGPRRADGTRIVKNVYLLIPKGNRKTSLASALIMLHSKGPERVLGGELLSAASDRKQARLVFSEVAGLIDPDWEFMPNAGMAAKKIDDARGAKIRSNSNKIIFPQGISYEAISSEAGGAHGKTPALMIADEVHAWHKRDPRGLWKALRAGLNKTTGALCIVASTAGRGQDNLCWDIFDYARRVASGEIEDPATVAILYETDKDADWRDERTWLAVNPGLSCDPPYPDLEGLRQYAREVEHRPIERGDFKQLHLNVWLDQSAQPFVDMKIYDAGAEPPIDLLSLVAEPCWLAVDLSSNDDLTVIVACWRNPDDPEGYIVWPWFFCPEDNLARKAEKDHVPYPLWAEQGYIEPTPGNVVDFRAVEDKIRDLCETFDVREIAIDPHLARNTLNNLTEDGYPATEMRQGWVTSAPCIKELERAIIGRRLRHGGNPALRWNFSNIAAVTDKAGNIQFHKEKSRDKIDGAVACWMAVGRASAGDAGQSIYSDPGISVADLVW